MTDTHCHLTFPTLGEELPGVLRRAREAGVSAIVNPGTDLEQSRAAVALAEREEGVRAAVGVHPQDIGMVADEAISVISELARHPKVVAIGEVGLEKSGRSPAVELQEQWVRRFVSLAREVQKPLIFHVREAHGEFRSFLEGVGWPARNASRSDAGVVHCFSGSLDDARWYTARGLFLGITGIVTFPNAHGVQSVVREIPLEHLLLETDAPFLAPQSHRGQRNEPAYVCEVAEEVARLKGASIAEVERVTDENARRLFSWPR